MSDERFISSELNAKEEVLDGLLRPQCFADFPGQGRVKELVFEPAHTFGECSSC